VMIRNVGSQRTADNQRSGYDDDYDQATQMHFRPNFRVGVLFTQEGSTGAGGLQDPFQ
jgi:hypothetical protein